jgi:hypothetical protein
MWTFFKLACLALTAVSLVFILYAFMKFAALQDDSSPKYASDDPEVTIVKAEPADRQQKRDQASMVLSVAGATFVASLGGLGFARWRQRSAAGA